jgi:glutamyl-tRNA synthetase
MSLSSSPETVRTRFAPSPSGHLHVGGARTALFCWAFAKGRGGEFILRIEDTDQKRSSDAASMAFLEDLKWLGIDWDEGPEFEGCGGSRPEVGSYFQSQRLDIYNRHIELLIVRGKAYRAFETSDELAAMRARAQAEKRNPRYDRAALELSPETVQQYLSEGRPHVVRFLVPDANDHGPVVVHDAVRGDVVTQLTELDDFVIRKADGFPMYNFAVVVDDELMGVTHVIRAQEHLSNTPRQILLAEAMGFRKLTFAHVSLISNPDGSKMSKRDKDKALRAVVRQRGIVDAPTAAGGVSVVTVDRWKWWIADKDNQLDPDEGERLAQVLGVDVPEINVDDFRRHGYLPEVLINYLALLGWNPGNDVEKFDREFLVKHFDFDRVIKSPAKFDRDKLLAFNNDAIQALTPEQFEQRYREHCERYHPEFVRTLNEEQFRGLARANQARSKTLESQMASSRFFILADDEVAYEQSKAVQEALSKGNPCGFDHLEAVLPALNSLSQWTAEPIETAVKHVADQHAEGKLGRVAQPLRIAVSGGTVSPAIFDTLVILGRSATLRRIERCLSMRSAQTIGRV